MKYVSSITEFLDLNIEKLSSYIFCEEKDNKASSTVCKFKAKKFHLDFWKPKFKYCSEKLTKNPNFEFVNL